MLPDYESRYAALFSEARTDIEEFLANGTVTRARELSSLTGQHFYDDRLPGFFGGDLDASVVMVHLNPRAFGSPPEDEAHIRTFEQWFDHCRNFGNAVYGLSSPRTHYSRFDRKQVAFLKALGGMEFVQERTGHPEDRFTNLERVIDQKLQMDLIPYGSEEFSNQGFTQDLLQPHFDRLLATITVVPRTFVLFCGTIFQPLLKGYVESSHEFHLRKTDGTQAAQRARFANLLIPFEGRFVRAGLAHSWPQQGINMTSYGEKIRELYDSTS